MFFFSKNSGLYFSLISKNAFSGKYSFLIIYAFSVLRGVQAVLSSLDVKV